MGRESVRILKCNTFGGVIMDEYIEVLKLILIVLYLLIIAIGIVLAIVEIIKCIKLNNKIDIDTKWFEEKLKELERNENNASK